MKTNTKKLTLLALLLAIEALFCFTPLGSIPLGPIVATLAAIPVIVAAIAIDTKTGAILGFFAGLFSLIVWTFMPPPTSAAMAFMFTPFYSLGEVKGNALSLVICFVPRILVGVFAGLSFKWLDKTKMPKIAVYTASAIIGSLANTFGVLFGAYFFFGALSGMTMALIGTTILTNGLPEAAVAAVLAYAVAYPLRKYAKK